MWNVLFISTLRGSRGNVWSSVHAVVLAHQLLYNDMYMYMLK